MPLCKRKKVECYISVINLKEVPTTYADNTQGVTWQSIGCTALNMDDRSCIISGDKLNNKHMNFIQMLIKQHLKHTEGLNTQYCWQHKPFSTINILQIMCTQDHWIVA